jgi:ABC-type Mn2+/Zn2+ transport system ATPase subunit
MPDASNDLASWLGNQHPWMQEAASRILSGPLADSDVQDLVRIMETPVDGTTRLPRAAPAFMSAVPAGDVLRLTSIGEIEGIDTLAPHEPLAFGSGNLTVIYGGNGSGKSGYTRILKKACGKPPQQTLASNVFKAQPEHQKCTLKYKVGSTERSVVWDAGQPIPELQPVDIFDASGGRVYLTAETKAAYVPAAVALFEDLVSVCERVASAIEGKKKALPSKLPLLPGQFAQSEAGRAYQGLVNVKEEKEILGLLSWTPDEEKRLAELEERLGPNDPSKLARQKTAKKSSVEALRKSLVDALAASGQTAYARLRTLTSEAEARRRMAKEGALALASTSRLEGVGADTWRSLWEAARSYSQETAYPGAVFPVTGEGGRCPLCQQDLADDAKERLRRFEAHVGGDLELAATTAETNRDVARGALPVRPNDAELAVNCQACGLDEDAWHEHVRTIWDVVDRQVGFCTSGDAPAEVQWLSALEFPAIVQLEEMAAALGRQAHQHLEDGKSFDKAKANADRLQLQCRQWTSQQSGAIKAELLRGNEQRRLDALRAMANSAPISKKLGTVANVLITDAYVTRFNKELAALAGQRAQPLRVELVKMRIDRGKAIHRLQFKGVIGSANPDQILSEGESRVVMLAAFLADTTANSRLTPFIFDDPISSLDHDFEWAVATRLAELARTRQVLVLTHRLSLYGFMDDAASLNGEGWKDRHLSQGCVERFGDATGRPVADPIWASKTDKANNNLLARLATAKKAHWDTGDSTGYRQLAQAICSDFRKLLERTVEADLLNKVVLRHRRSVTTYNTIGQLAKISREDCAYFEEMMSKYSAFEHSQSSETPVEVPDEPALRADLERLRDWRIGFRVKVA